MEIFRVHISDILARRAILDVMNVHHNGRIRQSILDFYRRDWRVFNCRKKSGGEVLLLVAIEDGIPIGMSACAIPRKDSKCWFSTTIVRSGFRRSGVGKLLLQAKLDYIMDEHWMHSLEAFVSNSHPAGLALCESAGMKMTGTGKRNRGEGKKPTEFSIFTRESRHKFRFSRLFDGVV